MPSFTVGKGVLRANRGGGIRFYSGELELTRRWGFRPEHLKLLRQYLELGRRSLRIVDVGCGTGFFTRVLASCIPSGSIVGIDRNSELLKTARKLATVMHSRRNRTAVSFRHGDARSLPIRSNLADRVVCHAFLWMIRDKHRVIKEMVRVCKPGGIVGSIEGSFKSAMCYYPSDHLLSNLEMKKFQASALGYHKLYGADRDVGLKLPSLFQELGLKRIRTDAMTSVRVQCDDRISDEDKVSLYKYMIKDLAGTSRRHDKSSISESDRILILGGMTMGELNMLKERKIRYLQRLISHPEKIETDTAVNIETTTSTNAGTLLVTTGVKPKF